VGDAGAAEEITQNVFVALAQAAGKLGSHPTLAGWLHQTALNKSREWLRAELRRRRREQVAVDSDLARAEGDSIWTPLVPMLDEALLKLSESDRQAIVLHYLEGRTFNEVGRLLGLGEDAARKRVNRCLDQLTAFFRQSGFAVPALTAGTPLFALSSPAAPAGLAATATMAGLATVPAATSTSTLTLLKGALKIMAWTKAKTVIVTGVVLLAAAGTTTLTLKEIQLHRSWRHAGFNSVELERQAPQVGIFPSRLRGETYGFGNNGQTMGTGVSAKTVIAVAYGTGKARVTSDVDLPATNFDYIASLPGGNNAALQREVRETFGLVAKYETRPAEVLVLKVKSPVTAGLKPAAGPGSEAWENWGVEHYQGHLKSLGHLASVLEWASGIPVIDATGLAGSYNLQLHWAQESLSAPNVEAMNLALNEQLGLELVRTNLPVPLLVVQKAE
jgi:uncharacterized protein (TIGR03435 family)